jgi:hypothetical protein
MGRSVELEIDGKLLRERHAENNSLAVEAHSGA